MCWWLTKRGYDFTSSLEVNAALWQLVAGVAGVHWEYEILRRQTWTRGATGEGFALSAIPVSILTIDRWLSAVKM